MSSRQRISIPVSKPYFSTFLNNFISITYLNDDTTNLESLKNLLFPIEFLDGDYLNLCSIIKRIYDDAIYNNKEKTEVEMAIKSDVSIDM